MSNIITRRNAFPLTHSTLMPRHGIRFWYASNCSNGDDRDPWRKPKRCQAHIVIKPCSLDPFIPTNYGFTLDTIMSQVPLSRSLDDNLTLLLLNRTKISIHFRNYSRLNTYPNIIIRSSSNTFLADVRAYVHLFHIEGVVYLFPKVCCIKGVAID